MIEPVAFAKGEGTGNDFVLLIDPDRSLDERIGYGADVAARLCDRRFGIGGDGVLRAVRRDDGWFMDYRNHDGSTAEMCGNGIRLFARHLHDEGLLVAGRHVIATRGGPMPVDVPASGDVTVDLGVPQLTYVDEPPAVTVDAGGPWPAVAILLPNPHAVVLLAGADTLDSAGDLSRPPVVTPADAFPDGVNVEFVVRRGDRHVAMRVHERGSGATLSCGTGAGAVAVAAALRDGAERPATYVVDVPGGRLSVRWDADGHVHLTGPARVVARGTLDPRWPADVAPSD